MDNFNNKCFPEQASPSVEVNAYGGGGGGAGNWLYFNAGGGEIVQPIKRTDNIRLWQDISACLPSDGNVTSIVTRYSQEGNGQASLGRFRFTDANGTFDLEKEVKIISKDDSDPFTITVDGGDWYGSDGSGEAGNQTYHQPSRRMV